MRRLLPLILVFGLVVAGCGDKTKTVTEKGSNGQETTITVPKVHFPKTKFLLHSGLAFGAFHRYILKPYKAGTFKKGAPKFKRSIAKAAVAGLFAVHELKQARRAALASDSLRKLAQPLDDLGGKILSLATSLKGGSFSPGALLGAAGGITALKKLAGQNGANIKDRNAPIPGL